MIAIENIHLFAVVRDYFDSLLQASRRDTHNMCDNKT